MNQLNKLKAKLAKQDEFKLDDIDHYHHVFMRQYGWISVEEFRKIPIPTFWNLLKEIEKEQEEEQKSMDKLKHKRK